MNLRAPSPASAQGEEPIAIVGLAASFLVVPALRR